MSDDAYTPRAGTTAHKIIEYMRKQPAGTALTGQELDGKLKIAYCGQAARKLAEAGLLEAAKSGNAYVYTLAAPPQPPDGKLTIAAYSDGDILVAGGSPNEDGSVTYTRVQLLQLIRFVMTPAIGMPVHSELTPVAAVTPTPLLPAVQE